MFKSKWVWTFGVGTPWKGKYVVVNTEDGDGREYMFNKYGQQNCCRAYPYEEGMIFVNRYGYKLIEEITL